jgi:prephenate dehydrogenase
MKKMLNRIVVIGTGLIGCSIALATKQHKLSQHIAGIDINDDNLKQAHNLGIIDEYCNYNDDSSYKQLIQKADWIILCVPVGVMPEAFAKLAKYILPHTIISDVGSTKQDVIHAAQNHLTPAQLKQFIPLHPIAGSEKHGPQAGKADLFTNKILIITPISKDNYNDNHEVNENILTIQNIWQQIGSKVVFMQASQHDDTFAMVSHLPHVLAFALMQYVLDTPNPDTYLELAGSGFKDFTRIAASSNIMWKDICIANKQAILQHLDGYIHTLQKLYNTIEQEQEHTLSEIFLQSAIARRKL